MKVSLKKYLLFNMELENQNFYQPLHVLHVLFPIYSTAYKTWSYCNLEMPIQVPGISEKS